MLLQNCHLGLNFMDELLATITETESVNESCRVWITTEVHPKFPISLLQVYQHKHYGMLHFAAVAYYRVASSLQMSLPKE